MAAVDKNKKEIAGDEEDDEKREQESSGQKGSRLTLIIIIVAVLLVLGGGGGAAYYFLFKSESAADGKSSTAKPVPQVVVFFPMDPFIVNLADNEGERYMKLVLQLELSDQKMLPDVKLLNPKMRDTILDLLSAKTYKEMIDPLGKQRLRDEIAMRMNMTINSPNGKVLKVYFTEFIIQ